MLDRWFVEQVLPRMRGPAHLIRYADDFVIVFADESDARRVVKVRAKRFGKYGLALLKSRMREFCTSGSVGGPGSYLPGSTQHP